MNQAAILLFENADTLNARLRDLHDRLLSTVPAVDRIACALYHPADDKLRTFINSTRHGQPLQQYEYLLSNSHSLSLLAQNRDFRVLDDLACAIGTDQAHSAWLLQQGYKSSFTVPLYNVGNLLGFVFFNSTQPGAFTAEVQRDLVLYCGLIGMSISSELAAIHTLVESTRLARELTGVRDFETGKHLERMAQYSRLIARSVARHFGLSDEFVEHIYLFAPLHDIGKIGIPDRILLKPGKLNDEEHRIMETHVEKGMEIIDRILGQHGVEQLPDSAILRNIVLCHHERLDGSGYPRGLRDGDIPVEARIVAVADIYDALTAGRPYKKVWSNDRALTELRRMADLGQLDDTCVSALEQQRDEALRIQAQYIDNEEDRQDNPAVAPTPI